jgi:hypothetical protein
MKDFSRRDVMKLGLMSAGTLMLPRMAFPALQQQDDDHFFLQIYVNGGADNSYMFDARPLEMTATGKIQNYLGLEPNLFTGANGVTTLATDLTKPLWSYRDCFSVLNGVTMSTSFDGHLQNLNDLVSGNPFGGDSFVPFLNNKINGRSITSIDAIQSGFIPAAVSNGEKIVPLSGSSVGPLAEKLKAITDLDGTELGAHIRSRISANSAGSGLFAGGAREMQMGFDQMAPLRARLMNLKSPDKTLDDETQFVSFLAGIFKQRVARAALWTLPGAFDTHAFQQAIGQPKMFTDYVGRLARIMKAMKSTPYDDKRSMMDVTTFLVTTEFGRTMRAPNTPIDKTGTNHNTLSNSLLIGGKGIRSNLVIGQSDFRTSTEVLSKAHAALDPDFQKLMGRPFDFSALKPRTDLPETFAETDYLNVGSVINTLFDQFGVAKNQWRTVGRDKVVVPSLKGLLI